jgi:diguanylate cyclase (GGDEF)-like protein
MYGMDVETMRPGLTLEQEMQDRLSRGLYSGIDPKAHIQEKLDIARANEPTNHVSELADGRILATAFQPMKGGGFVVTVEDVTERRRAEKRIAHIANHDYLTGLPNRAAFSEHLVAALGETVSAQTELAILCLDLDRFKEVNDLHGHLVGDALLREVARRLHVIADGAFLARIGGDEFVLITAGSTQAASVGELARRLREAVMGVIEVGGRQLQIGLSVGIAVCPRDGRDPTVLLANADLALYRAKAEGHGSIRFFVIQVLHDLSQPSITHR